MLKFAPTILFIFILILIPTSSAYGATKGFFWLYVLEDPIEPGDTQRLAAEVYNRSTGEPTEGKKVTFEITPPNGYPEKYYATTDQRGYAEVAFEIITSADTGRWNVKVTSPQITTNAGYFEVMEAD